MKSAKQPAIDHVAKRFHVLGQPARLRILLAIGAGEACVCHLEALLGYRQAYISQQLMLLKENGLVIPKRIGKHIFYSLSDCQVLDLIYLASRLEGLNESELVSLDSTRPLENCHCPNCHPEWEGEESAIEPGIVLQG